MPDLLAAVDVGTSTVRALVFEPDGFVVSQHATPLRSTFPHDGWVEQDPDEMWSAVGAVLSRLDHRDAISSIGVVTQRSTVIAWSARTGEALAPAIGWQDTRTAQRTEELRAMQLPASAQASATKIEWLVENNADVRAAARTGDLRVGTPDTWIMHKLGHPCTDPSNASTTLLYDIGTAAWHDGLCALFGVDPAWLAPVVPTSEVYGEMPSHVLGHRVPIGARAGDQQAACFGHGLLKVGQAKLTLGSSAMLDLNTGRDMFAPNGTYPLALWQLSGEEVQFCTEGSVHAAGSSIEWLIDLGILDTATALDRVVGSVPETGGLRVVPALQGLGAPFNDDSARGFLGGLTRGTNAGQVVRATVEGIAHSCVDLIEAVGLAPHESIHVDGGLAQSHELLQMLADYSGRRVIRSTMIEATGLGGALLAGLATGIYASAADAALAAQFEDAIVPTLPADRRCETRDGWADVVGRVIGYAPETR